MEIRKLATGADGAFCNLDCVKDLEYRLGGVLAISALSNVIPSCIHCVWCGKTLEIDPECLMCDGNVCRELWINTQHYYAFVTEYRSRTGKLDVPLKVGRYAHDFYQKSDKKCSPGILVTLALANLSKGQ